MKLLRKKILKRVLLAIFWMAMALGTIFLLVKGLNKKEEKSCAGIIIEILGSGTVSFTDKNDVLALINKYNDGKITGKLIRSFDIQRLEKELLKDVWLNKADLFFDNNGVLNVRIREREPFARLFTTNGESFYIDDSIAILPLSSRHTARLPVFTGFQGNSNRLTKADSSLLVCIKKMGQYILVDTFLMSMIDQIDINSLNQFELIPKMGDQVVLFGDTSQMDQKFKKFNLFYTKVIPKYGWNKYNKIDLQYNNQLVARIKGKEDIIEDSLRTIRIMKTLADFSSKMASDSTRYFSQDNELNSTDISMVLGSLQRDEGSENSVANDTQLVVINKKAINIQDKTKRINIKKN